MILNTLRPPPPQIQTFVYLCCHYKHRRTGPVSLGGGGGGGVRSVARIFSPVSGQLPRRTIPHRTGFGHDKWFYSVVASGPNGELS